MAVESHLDTATATVTLRHPDRGELVFRPDDAEDLPRFWIGWAR